MTDPNVTPNPMDFQPPSWSNESLGDAPKQRKQPNKLLIIGLVLVVVIGVAVILLKLDSAKKQTSNSHATSISSVTVISLKDGAAVPGTVEVKAGTTVKWDNQDTVAHQLVALGKDAKPIANFNSDLQLQPGDSYSFVFEQAGTYTYHDNQAPLKAAGTIIVK